MTPPAGKRKRDYEQNEESRIKTLHGLIVVAISAGAEAFEKAADESIKKNDDTSPFFSMLKGCEETFTEEELGHLEWIAGWIAQ